MTNETIFHLEGQFLGVCALDGYKLKYMRLRTANGDFLIKIPKELRGGMVYKLSVGDRIYCEGIQKDSKLKAYSIEKVDQLPVISHVNKPEIKILICQKSHCLNNGAKEVYEALVKQINSHNLNDVVTVKSTGCMKCCKQSPNLRVLPDKSSYSNVRISDIPAIISKVKEHLPAIIDL